MARICGHCVSCTIHASNPRAQVTTNHYHCDGPYQCPVSYHDSACESFRERGEYPGPERSVLGMRRANETPEA